MWLAQGSGLDHLLNLEYDPFDISYLFVVVVFLYMDTGTRIV